MTEKSKAWQHRSLWLIIITGGFALRLYRLGAGSLWYDETVSAYLASKSIPDLIAHTARDIHPPGYYLLLHVWARLAGDSEFALAFFSLIFGLLLIPLTYTLARRLLGQTVALWSALLVATSPYNLWYSQEVRMYTLGAALGLVTLWFALKMASQPRAGTVRAGPVPGGREPANWHGAVGYALAATTGLYVLYYFGFLLATLNLFIIGHLFLNRRPAALRTWLLAQVAVLILYLPWLPIAWRQATSPPVPPWRSFIPPHTVALEAWTALSLGQSVQPGQVWPILLVAGVLLLLGLRVRFESRNLRTGSNDFSRFRLHNASDQRLKSLLRALLKHALKSQVGESVNQPRAGTVQISPVPGRGESPISNLQSPALLIAYTFGPLILIYLVSLITPLYHVRYLFTYAPPFYILLGAGLARLTHRARPLAAIAALALLAGSAFSIREMHTNPRYAADDFRAAVSFIADRWRPGDAILINAGYAYTGFLYYYDGPIAGRIRLTDYSPTDDLVTQSYDRPLLLQTGTVGGDPTLGWGDPDSDFYATTEAETAAALTRVTQTFPRLWVLRIYDTVTDPNGFVRNWLATNTTPFEDRLFAGESFMRVQGFMSNNQPLPPEHADVALEREVRLVGWQVQPTAPAGGPLDVVLWWQADAPLTTNYAVSLKLWGTEGQGPEANVYLAAQQDEWPVGSLLFTSAWPPGHVIRHPMRLWLPAGLPPGQYWLDAEMYDPATVQPLPRRDGQGHAIPLGAVTVTPSQ